jgi:hypothetical protein
MWFYDRRNIGFKELAIAAVPYVTGGILMGLYISQDFESFRAQMARNSGGRFGILHPVDTFMSEIRTRYIAAYGLGAHSAGHDSPLVRLKAIPLVAYLAGAIGFLAFRSVRTKLSYASLFGLGALHWFLLAFYENMKFSYYLVHLVPFYAVILAIFVVHLWQQRAVPKWLIATGLAGVALVQIGGIGMKIRLNNYGNSYAPAVEYVKAHATPQDLVYASCGFGFAYGFDSHYRDDETFGYFSKEKATFIVVEEIYDGQHAYMKAALPDQYAHVQRTLDSYELVYRNAEYRVYQRPNVP